MKKLKQGFLISIEGIDGSGKSTLANKLRDSLQKEKFPVVLTYEPGDTKIGKQFRTALQEKPYPMCDKTEFLLYAADRAQHIQDVIKPELYGKKIVISDRMADSSLAYQGYGRGLDLGIIKKINEWVMECVKPDITLYIKVSTTSAVERLKKRKGRPTSIEKEKEAFTKKVVEGFDTIFKNRSDVIILDGEQSEQMLHKIAHANIINFLRNRQN